MQVGVVQATCLNPPNRLCGSVKTQHENGDWVDVYLSNKRDLKAAKDFSSQQQKRQAFLSSK